MSYFRSGNPTGFVFLEQGDSTPATSLIELKNELADLLLMTSELEFVIDLHIYVLERVDS